MPNPQPQEPQAGPWEFLHWLQQNFKPGYYSGQNAIARAQTRHGFRTTNNMSYNLLKIGGGNVDPGMLIKQNSPAAQIRRQMSTIGTPERIYNTYWKPRVKLAD